MPARTRRAVLATLAGLSAGCSRSASDTGSDRTDHDGTATPEPATVALEPTDADRLAGDTVTVYRQSFAAAIREAASGDDLSRSVVDTPIESPSLPLASVDAVTVTDERGDAGGTYALSIESGPHVTVKLHLEAVSEPPADATVYDATELSEPRVDAVREAALGRRAEVPIERPTAQWIRDELVGAYVRYEGTTYRAIRLTGTDNGFFETAMYWILGLDPVSATPDTSLRLPALDEEVRARLDALLARQETRPERLQATVPVDSPVVAFGRDTDLLLDYARLFEVTVSV